MADVIMPGKKSADKAAKEQRELMKKQREREAAELAEQESEIAKRRAMASSRVRGGRSLLIATSNKGIAKNLGGTR